ncbi:MAG: DUF5655 domain-containing protein [Allosphingosinicella sp.]
MSNAPSQRPLWTCPDCGQSFVTPRMSHSCVRLTEDDFFAGRAAQRALYDAWLAFARRNGPVTVNVNRTRISFQGRVRFAAVNRVTRDGLVCHLWLKRRIESARFSRVECLPPGNWVHHFRLTGTHELDDEAAGWLAEAYEVGMQRWNPPPGPADQIPAYHS